MGIIYSKYKMFHYPEKLNSLDDKKLILPPLQVRIKPTNMCNHNCWYCAYKAENLQLGKDMVERDYIPLNKMLEIIKDLDEMGVKSLTFSGGGEPLTYKYMRESLEALSQTKVKFASLTNGSKLNGDVSQLFKQYGSWIRVSIDGWDDNSYAKYRNVKSGEFSKVIKNMYEFSKLNGECLLGVSIIIDKDNAPHLENLVKLLKDTGVKSIKLSPCITHNESELTNSYHSDFFEITKEKCKIIAQQYSDKDCEILDSYHLQLTSFKKNYSWCPYLQICPVIGADLNVYACHDKAYNLDSGVLFSIKNKGFKEAWMNDKNSFFNINPTKNCNHHCVVDEKNRILLEYLNIDKNHLEFV